VAKKGLMVALVVAGLAALTGSVLATPGGGVLSGTVFARAAFADPTDIKFKIFGGRQEVILAPQARDTVMQQIVIAPGGHTGWHSHPGPVVVLVKAGALTFYDGDDPSCTARTYSAGQAFVDSGQGHVHIARNLSTTENLELWATYFDVPAGGAFRLDRPDPGNCTF
jgi:quercetin dioxygenase-like cupin family protein